MKHFARVALVGCIVLAWLASSPPAARADWRSLSGLLPAFATTYWYTISPDSKYVAYIAEAETDDVSELYIVPLAGGAPLKLNPPLTTNGDVERGWAYFSTDSKYVFYIADQEVDNRRELYRVPVTGGQAVKLNTALVAGGNVMSFQVDPDGQRIVYLADQDTNEVFELWSISATGGGLFKLNGPLPPGGDVSSYAIDSISNRVVYTADQELDERSEVYSTPIAGGTPTNLNPDLANNTDVFYFQINAVIPVIVFTAQEVGATTANLWMIPTVGGIPPTQLNFNLPVNDRIIGFQISPFGDRVVFNVATSNDIANRGYAFAGNLYSTLIGGGGNANLTETAEPYFGVDIFRFTPDGKYVLYQYQKNASIKKRFESSTVQSGVRATLYEPSGSDPPLYLYRISPDSNWIMYTIGSSYASQDLNAIPPGGGSPVRLGPGIEPLSTPDSSRVVYARITGSDSKSDLYSAQIFGGDVRDLSGMDGTGYIGDVKVSPDGKWIVYAVQLDSRYDLRVSDGNAAQPSPTPSPPGQPTPSGPGQPTPTPGQSPERILLPIAQR